VHARDVEQKHDSRNREGAQALHRERLGTDVLQTVEDRAGFLVRVLEMTGRAQAEPGRFRDTAEPRPAIPLSGS
jgi:hypothetical protein